MYTTLLFLHSLLRWVILILLVVAILRHLGGMNVKRAVNSTDKKVDLFLMTSAHITLLIGLIQWFIGPWGFKNIQALGMGEVMKNTAYRFWAIEHITGMLIAIVFITIGRGAVKRATSPAAHKKAFWFFLLALLIILATVPWPFREAIARPLLPHL